MKIKYNKGYYLPLFNMNGIVSSITPFFSGDLKKGYYNYALKPTTEVDLFNLTDKRNVLFFVNNERYDLNGQMSIQQADDVEYDFKMLSQRVVRKNQLFTLDTTSFVPVTDSIELHKVTITNTSNKPLEFKIVTSIPLYGRSPENIHDHRHVTSLLNEVHVCENGIINKPTLSFDERGHKKNDNVYSVFANIDKVKVKNYVPTIDDYINGGSYLNPLGLDEIKYQVGDVVKGYEAIGAIGFEEFTLNSNETVDLMINIGIFEDMEVAKTISKKYFDIKQFDAAQREVLAFFEKLTNYIEFNIENTERNNQLKWVTLQPILRRFLGNSYLPHHDYGHGGRGWRDLWQDLLALIFANDESVKTTIINNFAGVRIDGSNATIIGNKPGEFIADRNRIVRVWSDHGAWPLLTVKMYIDETGDLDILNVKQSYFSDQFTHYTKKANYQFAKDNNLYVNDSVYQGSILEHLLLQNIVGHLNVGKKGFVKLEDADWNDGLDMANKNGETIAFTHFYVNNLRVLVKLIKKLGKDIEILEDLNDLINHKITVAEYFDKAASFNGVKVLVKHNDLCNKLEQLITERLAFIKKNAWINDTHYQSYVDNDGNFLDNDKTMSLTAQAIALINDIPSKDESLRIASKTKTLLYDKAIGGYRLNSDYHKILMNMGRAFGFAYGHKENGAVFSHMATMYAYGLYNYDLISYGNEAITTLLDRALNEDSHVLAGVPEYFNDRGIGKYSFLTGTASWMIKLFRTEIFGINLDCGKLTFNPKLTVKDFIDKTAAITTYLFGKKVTVKYVNAKNLDYGTYQIKTIYVDGIETTKRMFEKIEGNVEVILDEINGSV